MFFITWTVADSGNTTEKLLSLTLLTPILSIYTSLGICPNALPVEACSYQSYAFFTAYFMSKFMYQVTDKKNTNLT